MEEVREVAEIAGETEINQLDNHFCLSKDEVVVPHGYSAMWICDQVSKEVCGGAAGAPLLTSRVHDGYGCYYHELVVEDTVPDLDYEYNTELKATDYTVDYQIRTLTAKRAIYIRESDSRRTSYLLVGEMASNKEFRPYWVVTPAEHMDYFFKKPMVSMKPLDKKEMKEKVKWDNMIKSIFEESVNKIDMNPI